MKHLPFSSLSYKNSIALIFFLFPILLLAQNWQPVNPDYIYFYKDVDSAYISVTVKVDSIKNVMGDQVHYFNGRFGSIGICSMPCNGDTLTKEFYSSNTPNLLQREMVYLGDNQYQFYNEISFLIHSGAALNESWSFCPEQNITAQVSSLAYEEIMPDIYDSVKEITLSNGSELKLSENFGIVKMPNINNNYENVYELQGIKDGEIDYGTVVPDFWDFYDFQVGDIFYTQSSSHYFKDIKTVYWGTYSKYTITDKWIDNNGYTYARKVYRTEITDFGNNTGTSISFYDTIRNINNVNSIVNAFPKNVVINQNSYGTTFIRVEITGNKYNDFLSKTTSRKFFKCEEFKHIFEPFYSIDEYYIFTPTMGRTNWFLDDNYYGYVSSYFLKGIIRNGEIIGGIYPDSLFGIQIEDNEIALFPNPANEYTQVTSPENNLFINLEIISITGAKVKSFQNIESSNKIDVTDLSPGIYTFIIQINDKVYNKKFIKVNL